MLNQFIRSAQRSLLSLSSVGVVRRGFGMGAVKGIGMGDGLSIDGMLGPDKESKETGEANLEEEDDDPFTLTLPNEESLLSTSQMRADYKEAMKRTLGTRFHKYSLFSQDDNQSMKDNQYLLDNFEYDDYMRLEDMGLREKVEEFYKMEGVTIERKVKLLMYSAKLLTPENVLYILEEAFKTNYLDEGQDFRIILMSKVMLVEENRRKIDQLFDRLYDKPLSSFHANQIILLAESKPELLLKKFQPEVENITLNSKKRGKKKMLSGFFTLLKVLCDKNMLQPLLTEDLCKLIFENSEYTEIQIYLLACLQEAKRKNISHQDLAAELSKKYSQSEWLKMLKIPLELIPTLDLDSKMILGHLFLEHMREPEFSQYHKEVLFALIHSLCAHTTYQTSFLVNQLLVKGHIQMEDLSPNINHGELQLNFCAYPDLYKTQNIGSNLSQYIYRCLNHNRYSQLALLGYYKDMYEGIHSLRERVILAFHFMCFILPPHKIMQSPLPASIKVMCLQMNPAEPEHLELFVTLYMTQIEIVRSLYYMMYNHSPENEDLFKQKALQFLEHYRPKMEALKKSSLKEFAKDPQYKFLLAFCIVVRFKAEIATPLDDELPRLSPLLNDVWFSILYHAIRTPKQWAELSKQLKDRIKTSKYCLSVKIVNNILGALRMRHLILKDIKGTEYHKKYKKDPKLMSKVARLTIPKTMASYTSPEFLNYNVQLVPYFKELMEIIEEYIIKIMKSGKVMLVKESYTTLLCFDTLFSPDYYRNLDHPLALITPKRHILPIKDVLRLCVLMKSLGRGSVSFWSAISSLLIDEKNNHIISSFDLRDLNVFVDCFSYYDLNNDKVWDKLQTRFLEHLSGPIYSHQIHLCIANISGFHKAKRGSPELWLRFEALIKAAWKHNEFSPYLLKGMTLCMRRGTFSLGEWLNDAIQKLETTEYPEALGQLVLDPDRSVLTHENYRKIIDMFMSTDPWSRDPSKDNHIMRETHIRRTRLERYIEIYNNRIIKSTQEQIREELERVDEA